MFWAYLGLFALGYVFGWLRGFWVGKLRGKLEGKGIVMKQGTAQSMAELRKQAQELGRSTSFTAVQVGDLQAKLAQKGFGRNAIKEMTDDVLALARAAGEGGEEDAVMSADLISGTLRAYQMEASEAGRVADVFTTAVNNSNFSLQGLLDGMAKAGPLASDFGLTLEETVATLASMTNLNITASESGVALQSFLARMSKGECSVCGSPAPMGSVLYRDGYGNKFCPKHWAQLPKERNCLETVSPINPNISNK